MKHTIQAISTAPTSPRIVLDISNEPASLAANETLTSVLTAAGQIKFPATQNPSSDPNTLDDYEEGTWTPTLAFGGDATGITYSVRTGRYVKVGKSVSVFGDFVLSNAGAAAAASIATIVGLPFTSGATLQFTAGVVSFYSGMAAGIGFFGCSVQGSTTVMSVYKKAAITASNSVKSDWGNTSRFTFSATYEAAS